MELPDEIRDALEAWESIRLLASSLASSEDPLASLVSDVLGFPVTGAEARDPALLAEAAARQGHGPEWLRERKERLADALADVRTILPVLETLQADAEAELRRLQGDA